MAISAIVERWWAASPAGGRERASVREDTMTVVFGTVMAIGICVDGWAHHYVIDTVEGFFTPYHAILYGGYLLTAGWIIWLAYRRRDRVGVWWRDGWPVGYKLGVLGLLIFAAGGFGDMIWHETLGVEIGLLPSFSPTHIIASIGALLMGTSPLRSWWASGEGGVRAMVGVVAMTYAAIAATVLLNWGSAFMTAAPTVPYEPVLGDYGGIIDTPDEFLAVQGIGSYIVTTLLILVPLLMMHRRRATMGAGTILVAGIGLRFMVINEFPDPYAFAALTAVVAAFLADVLLVRLDAWRGPDAPMRMPIAGLLFAVLLWSGQLLGLHLAEGLRWPPELWGGMLVLTGGLGLLLGGLATRPTGNVVHW